MNRGMDHRKMLELIGGEGPIVKFQNEIDTFFTKLESDFVKEVQEAYEGDAAQLFNQNLKQASTKMQKLLEEILTKCKSIAEGKDTEYHEQEKRLESAFDGGQENQNNGSQA